MAEFYVVCQPGLEEELKSELQEFWPFLLEKDSLPHTQNLFFQEETLGGVSLECSEILGYQINFFSKLASRVLLRLDQFKATDFGKLKTKLTKLNLDPFFAKHQFRVEISAAKSRLNNEKRIHEVCEQVWKTQLNDEADFALFIRVFDDQFTISLDTSGEHLHFRNSQNSAQKKIGEAPLRETLAAFMARKLIEGYSVAELQKISLTDPMAGSGTLLTESALLYQPNLQREFSFQKLKNCPKILKSELLEKNYPAFPKLFSQLLAADFAPDMIPVLKENLAKFPHQVSQAEVISQPPKGEGFLLVNPPYGERIQKNFQFQELAKVLLASQFIRVGVLLPQSAVREFQQAAMQMKSHYRETGLHRFKNGGIPVVFLIYSQTV